MFYGRNVSVSISYDGKRGSSGTFGCGSLWNMDGSKTDENSVLGYLRLRPGNRSDGGVLSGRESGDLESSFVPGSLSSVLHKILYGESNVAPFTDHAGCPFCASDFVSSVSLERGSFVYGRRRHVFGDGNDFQIFQFYYPSGWTGVGRLAGRLVSRSRDCGYRFYDSWNFRGRTVAFWLSSSFESVFSSVCKSEAMETPGMGPGVCHAGDCILESAVCGMAHCSGNGDCAASGGRLHLVCNMGKTRKRRSLRLEDTFSVFWYCAWTPG